MRPGAAAAGFALLVLAGCLLPFTPSACATPPSPPLTMEVRVEDACAFYGEGSRAVVVLRPFDEVRALRSGVVLPEGVELVSGNLSFEGDARGRIVLEGVLRAREPGRHVLYAWTDAPSLRGLGSSMAPRVHLAVEGNASAARAAPANVPPPAFLVRIGAEEGNASRLVATVVSPVAMEATILLYASWPLLPEPAPGDEGAPRLVEGHPEWTGERAYEGDMPSLPYLVWRGRLHADEPQVLRFHAPLPGSEGEWTVAAYLLPQPEVSNGVLSDEAGWLFQDGRGTLLRNRQPWSG